MSDDAPAREEEAVENLTVISVDCHAGLRTEGYREYLEPRFQGDLDDYLENRRLARERGALIENSDRGFAFFSNEYVRQYKDDVEEGGPHGAWDFERRRKELDADGVAAEVIFPGPVNLFTEASIPFQGRGFFGDVYTVDYPLDTMWAGVGAYHRWLAEVADPAYQAMLFLVPSLRDIDRAIKELTWAAGRGFRGVIIRQHEEGLPLLADERYEPVWSACEDLGLPVHFHGGVSVPLEEPMNSVAGENCLRIETAFWGYRPLWYLMFGGVFERHPRLKAVFTEVHASWVPGIVDTLDVRYEDAWLTFRDYLPRRPSEYWHDQCAVGASFLSREEVELRDLIGTDNLMYGSDYPHVEGIWPHTKDYLKEIFFDVPADEVRKMAAGNAAALYGFDMAHLAERVASIGPSLTEVIERGPSPASAAVTDRAVGRAVRPGAWILGGIPRGFVREQRP